MNPIVIIGTGLAGYQLAKEFRKLDQTTPLMLITADEGRFYSKPLLSTALTNKKNIEGLTTASSETMATQLNATIRTETRITEIDTENQMLQLSDETIPYSKLVLACGAEVIKLTIPGNEHIFAINNIHDYGVFHSSLQNKKNITIIGAGLIGCEFANDLVNAGYKVNVIALGETPLDLLLPKKIGNLLKESLEKNGVKFFLGTSVTAIQKINLGFELTLSTRQILETELILSAIGLKPHLSLTKNTPILTNKGILVNRFLETNIKNIYALGDCAEVEGHVLPYITPLLNASRALAKTLAQEKTAVEYPAMPVIVKTPAHPIVVCPPPKNMQGEWKIDIEEENVRALFYNNEHQLYGFILTNGMVKERMNWVKQIPALF